MSRRNPDHHPRLRDSTILLCTTDLALCERVRRNVQSIQPMASQMAIRQAELMFAAVREIHQRLKDDGHLINSEEELKKREKRHRFPAHRRRRFPWRLGEHGDEWVK